MSRSAPQLLRRALAPDFDDADENSTPRTPDARRSLLETPVRPLSGFASGSSRATGGGLVNWQGSVTQGSDFFVAGCSKTVTQYSMGATGAAIRNGVMEGHLGCVIAVSVDTVNGLLYSASVNGTIIQW